MMLYEEHPFSPTGRIVRVRREYQAHVAGRIGEVYASSSLALRRCDGCNQYFAPVVLGPGGVLCFIWPEEVMDVAWMEDVALRGETGASGAIRPT